MEIRVLGPIEISAEQGTVRLGARMHQRLLAALVIGERETRSRDMLIEALWSGEKPPASAPKLLQVYVSQLRKVLPASARIETRGAGYSLEVDADSVDAARFERLLGEAMEALGADNPRLCLSLLGRALDLWRGPAYAEVAYDDFARPEAERLEELRRVAIELRIEAGLALGRHEELLGEVLSLANTHPLRERLQTHAMLALYRCGRHSEALDVYAAHRRALRDELGLEPGPELRELQRRILEHDSSLALPTRIDEAVVLLPAPPNKLLGRERDVAGVAQLLDRDDVRLVVLTGAGGSGKTRLALEVARAIASSFANGAVFISLASLRDPALVIEEICRALNIVETADEEPLQTLVKTIQPQELLLVIDNVEHVREAAPVFVELIASAPRLTLLATSRVVLHLSGEHVYPVEPLDEDDAVALFIERARDANPRFSAAPHDNETIRMICNRLDGLPLAIELGAGRTSSLTPSELLARLSPSLPLLIGGPRDLPDRQQTLRATLQWTFGLLDEQHFRDLTQLAVFAGGCTLSAAEAVCGTTVDRLSALVDFSLLRHQATETGSRYSMLETVRESASEARRLGDSSEAPHRRHAEFFCDLAERAELELEGSDQAARLRALDDEHDNLRTAIEWCFEAGEPTLGARFAASLWRFWYLRGQLAEGARCIERALGAATELPSALESKLLKAGALLAHERSDVGRMTELTTRRLALARTQGDSWEVAACLNNLGLAAIALDDVEHAERHFRESVRLCREIDEARVQHIRPDVPLGNLSWLCLIVGDLVGAETFATESMEIARRRGDVEQIIAMTIVLSLIRVSEERPAEALTLVRAALELADPLESTTIFCALCTPIAVLLGRQGHLERAAQVIGKKGALRDAIGRPRDWYRVGALDDVERLARSDLGDDAFADALTVGVGTGTSELFASALRDAERPNPVIADGGGSLVDR